MVTFILRTARDINADELDKIIGDANVIMAVRGSSVDLVRCNGAEAIVITTKDGESTVITLVEYE